ncbi:lipase family protein [Francisella philomiragia]|uniref:lipase family protein n=1 Tax=Francisella philomiragia TaxID=28110 RepID=UPI0005A56862|nr:hypothetical protein [Francisella philomiragia]AJI56215.1 lipase family protein [Francisella philomiragia]
MDVVNLIQIIEEYCHTPRSIFSNHGKKGIERALLLQDIVNRLWLSSDSAKITSLHLFLKKYIRKELQISDFDNIISSTQKKIEAKELLNGGNLNNGSLRTVIKDFLKYSCSKTTDDNLPKIISEKFDLCIFSYKIFSQIVYSIDPFFEDYKNFRNNIFNDINPNIKKRLDYLEMDILYDKKYNLPDFDKRNFYIPEYDDISIFDIPKSLKNKIRHIYLVHERKIKHMLNKKDSNNEFDMFIFTGRTGDTSSRSTQGQVSYIGYVLNDLNKKEINIVFRGSRSGNVSRSALDALIKSKGNSDWVTDMNIYKTKISDNKLNSEVKEFIFGRNYYNLNISSGFALSAFSIKENLNLILQALLPYKNDDKYMINITGHSLGGALAQICYLSMIYGNFHKNVCYSKDKVFCYPFSAPPFIEKVSKNLTPDELNIIKSKNILHTFINSDIVRDVDFDNSNNPLGLRIASTFIGYRRIMTKSNMTHIGRVILRLNPGYISNILFPESHGFGDIFDQINNPILRSITKNECSEVNIKGITQDNINKVKQNMNIEIAYNFVQSIRLYNFVIILSYQKNEIDKKLSQEIQKLVISLENFNKKININTKEDLVARLNYIIFLLDNYSTKYIESTLNYLNQEKQSNIYRKVKSNPYYIESIKVKLILLKESVVYLCLNLK